MFAFPHPCGQARVGQDHDWVNQAPPVEPSLSHSAVRKNSKCTVWNGEAKMSQR